MEWNLFFLTKDEADFWLCLKMFAKFSFEFQFCCWVFGSVTIIQAIFRWLE